MLKHEGKLSKGHQKVIKIAHFGAKHEGKLLQRTHCGALWRATKSTSSRSKLMSEVFKIHAVVPKYCQF